MSQAIIKVSIPTSSDKLRQNFPHDPKGDIQITFKNRIYKLQKAHLRLQSSFFRKVLTSNRSTLHINEDFNEQYFNNILLCFYGAVLQIPREYAIAYYPILQFLEIQPMIKIIRNDMVENAGQYNFFELFDLAYRYADQIIFQKCLLEMEHKDFIQIRNERQSLLKVTEELFKLIVKAHNRLQRSKRVLNAYEINYLIGDYCSLHKLTIGHNNNMKFQLIDKNNLTSQEYQDIFINEPFHHDGFENSFKKSQMRRAYTLCQVRSEGNIPISAFQTSPKMTLQFQKSFELEMDTTFQKKISEELIMQKNKLKMQIRSLSDQTVSINQKAKTTKQQFSQLRKKINEEDNQSTLLTQKIKSIDNDLESMQKNLTDQGQRLKRLFDNAKEMLNKYENSKDINSQSIESSSSSIWNFNDKDYMINDFVLTSTNMNMGNNEEKSSKSNKSNTPSIKSNNINCDGKVKGRNTSPNIIIEPFFDQAKTNKSNKEDFYTQEPRLEFSSKSSIIRHLKQLVALATIVTDYTKIKLKLLYKASRQNYKNGLKSAKAMDQVADSIRAKTKDKQKLLFLVRTQTDQVIGGYTSVRLNLFTQEDIQDQNAFIFTLTYGKKFRVKKTQKQDAIMINQGYIICFGTDLMISDRLFEMQNYCGWPNTYEGNKDLEERGSNWFAGDSQFSIKQIQCYQIDDSMEEIIA